LPEGAELIITGDVSVSAASKVKYLVVVESFDWHLTAYEAQELSLGQAETKTET